MEGEKHGDVQPLGQPLDDVGAGVAAVGPDQIRPVLLQEVVAGGEEGVELLRVRPRPAVGRAEERHGNVPVRREEQLALVGTDPCVTELVTRPILVQDVLDGDLFHGVRMRATEDATVEARLGQQLQGVEGRGRRAVGGVDGAVGRDEGDLAGLGPVGKQRPVAIHGLALLPVVEERLALPGGDVRTAVGAGQAHVVAAALQRRKVESGPRADEPLPVVPIGLPAALVEPARLLPPLPPMGHAQGHDDVLQEQLLGDAGGDPGGQPSLARPVFVDVIVPENQNVGLLAQPPHMPEVIGIVLVVAIQECQQVAAGDLDRRIARGGHAAVLLQAGSPDPVVGGSPPLEDLPGVVRRTVVGSHDLPLGEFLGEDGAHRAVQRKGAVVHGHDDGDKGLHVYASDQLAIR